MPVFHIDDGDDPRIALFRNVSDANLLRDHGLFVAEGRLVVRTLIGASRLRTQAVLVTRPALDGLADLVRSRPGVPFLVVSQAIINDIVGFNIHRGCLALGQRPAARPLDSLLDGGVRRLVVLENVSNADNIGGIFRCATALGADGVVLRPHCCDPLYRKAIRTSIGASLVVPFAGAGPWPDAIERLQSAGYRVVALTPASDARSIDDAAGEIETAELVAVLAGSEGTGLTGAALERADVRVRIPMASSVDSLNVAVAVGIALHRLAGAGLKSGATSHRPD